MYDPVKFRQHLRQSSDFSRISLIGGMNGMSFAGKQAQCLLEPPPVPGSPDNFRSHSGTCHRRGAPDTGGGSGYQNILSGKRKIRHFSFPV